MDMKTAPPVQVQVQVQVLVRVQWMLVPVLVVHQLPLRPPL
jgi:hypothetical protein